MFTILSLLGRAQLAFAVLCSLSNRKCTVRFWNGTQKTRSFQGRPRSLSSSSPFSWSPWQVLTCAPLFATLLVAATHRMQEWRRRKLLCLFPPVQSSTETAAAETDEELVQQVVMGGSAQCSCVSCYSSSSHGCPVGCSAPFCSAAFLPPIKPHARS